MKTKNLALAIVAFALAIGSAFAALLTPDTVYVKAITQTTPNPPTDCISTQVQCDVQGNETCQVTVPLRNGGTQIASSSGPIFTYRVGCSFVLKSIEDEAHTSPLTGNARPIELVED
jgi:hypothetical protein